MTHEYNDYPLSKCLEDATELILRGARVYQKFTCSGCGSRQTMDVPNKFFTIGRCEECGTSTDLRVRGCNYLLIMGERP